MKPWILAAALLACGCKKEAITNMEYLVVGGKFRVTYTDQDGQFREEIGRERWKKSMTFMEGQDISLGACPVYYDSTFVEDDEGHIIDTVLTAVPPSSLTIWVFVKGDRLAVESDGTYDPMNCVSLVAEVPGP